MCQSCASHILAVAAWTQPRTLQGYQVLHGLALPRCHTQGQHQPHVPGCAQLPLQCQPWNAVSCLGEDTSAHPRDPVTDTMAMVGARLVGCAWLVPAAPSRHWDMAKE